MTALNRPFVKPAPALALAAALIVAASVASVAAPAQAQQQPNSACDQALAYEKTAANDSSTRQAAYDAAVAGLAINQRCNDAEMKLVNEAYLLSMRATAEHELKVGNWQRDMTRANMLLTQCTNWPGLKNKKPGIDCDTQRRYNDIIAKKLATPPPTARPATPAPAMTSPAPGTTGGAARPTPAPLPTPPSPNRPPR